MEEKKEIRLKLIEGDVMVKRLPIRKGRYIEYERSLKRLLPWIVDKIEEHGTIKIGRRNLTKELGKEFEHKSFSAVYNGLKFILFYKGIVVETGTATLEEGMDKVFILRKKNRGDHLPSSLKRLEYKPAWRSEPTEPVRVEPVRVSSRPVESVKKESFEIKENNIIGKYHKYSDVINKIGLIPKLKSFLTKEDIVELDAEELIKDMGLTGRRPQSVLNGLRCVLYPEGIKVRYHSHKTIAAWDQIFIFEKT